MQKVRIFRGQNDEQALVRKINNAITKENKNGWRIVDIKTECTTFKERFDEKFGIVPQHFFLTTTILLEKET